MPHSSKPKQKITQKHYCNKFNKDYKYGPHQKKVKKQTNKKNEGDREGSYCRGQQTWELKTTQWIEAWRGDKFKFYVKKKKEFGHDL